MNIETRKAMIKEKLNIAKALKPLGYYISNMDFSNKINITLMCKIDMPELFIAEKEKEYKQMEDFILSTDNPRLSVL